MVNKDVYLVMLRSVNTDIYSVNISYNNKMLQVLRDEHLNNKYMLKQDVYPYMLRCFSTDIVSVNRDL